MDVTQILITVTLSVTTVFMILIGYQVIKILQEIRIMLKKAQTIVSSFEKVGSGVENGFNEVMGFVGGMKSVFSILEIFRKRTGKQSGEERERSTP